MNIAIILYFGASMFWVGSCMGVIEGRDGIESISFDYSVVLGLLALIWPLCLLYSSYVAWKRKGESK